MAADKDFDLDRVVADPKYRRWVIDQLKARDGAVKPPAAPPATRRTAPAAAKRAAAEPAAEAD